MKVLSWNINGIRATKDVLNKLLDSTLADVICLQETKITKDQLESDIALIDGYNSYFSFSQVKSGYSGVATYCKNSVTPVKAQCGLSDTFEKDAADKFVGCYGNLASLFNKERLKELDNEGRTVITQHELKSHDTNQMSKLSIINVYCPRADPEKEERKFFKLDFYKALEERAKALLCAGSYVIIIGDINTSHKPIDHCDPKDPVLFYDNLARAWLDSFVYNDGDYSSLPKNLCKNFTQKAGVFVDGFRYFYPNKQDMYTCWCSSNRARETNYGTRLDYVFCDALFAKKLKSCEILCDVSGSDHCPIEGVFDIFVDRSKTRPSLCTCFMAEFGGRQKKLSSYFSKKSESSSTQLGKISGNKRSICELMSNNSAPPLITKQRKKSSQLQLTSFVSITGNSASGTKEKLTQISSKSNSSSSKPSSEASMFWKKILKGPDPPPLCSGHNEPSVLRTVKKDGPNVGRQFYCCNRPEGNKSNPDARCQFFQWRKNR